MTKRQPKVPETRTPNRAQRRGHTPAADEPLVRDPHPLEDPAVPDARGKNTGRGKKTADKWNQ